MIIYYQRRIRRTRIFNIRTLYAIRWQKNIINRQQITRITQIIKSVKSVKSVDKKIIY